MARGSKGPAGRGVGKRRRGGSTPTPAAAPLSAPRILPIVGIGSSAGGLEALQDFFNHMPADSGAAFVVVTHQHAGRVSLLPELLSRATAMPVVNAGEGVAIEPNHVYVAMPDGLLEIAGGVLHLERTQMEDFHYRPIDHFLRFLAADQGEHAIGIILSGAGSDGTLGVTAVKAAGGMIVVQEPTSAKYASMPASANATSLADYILPPAEMPGKLVAYVGGPYLQRRPPMKDSPRLPDEAIARILVSLRGRTGHDFTGYKKNTISRRIERRMNVHHIEQPDDYLRYLQDNPHEAKLLMRELLISVTSFFRDPEAFEVLAKKALPAMLASRPDRNLRIWVPGCATGEEAYSVAILLKERIRQTDPPMNIQLFATDLDEHAIDVARAGFYPEGIAADVPTRTLEQCFAREESGYRVHKDIREMLVFATQNVLKDPPFTKLDLIVCRNLLIYLGAEAQKRLLPLFHYALRPGGLLFLGSSEGIGELGDLFETLDGKWKIHRRKEGATGFLPLPPHVQELRGSGPVESAALRTRPGDTVPHLQRMLLATFAPPSVVVDVQGNIIYTQGRTGLYLEPPQGAPSNNVLQMAREGLSAALAGALRKAQSSNHEVIRRNVRVRTNHAFTRVNVTVTPITQPESIRGLFLVTFVPAPEPAPQEAEPPKEAAEAPSTKDEELQRELLYTRESLQSTIEELETSNEELRSSNEELQSTNEELQSSNEELETSKEEMQSLNEELNTVNAELQSKVDDLAKVRDDMKNLLNSTQLGCVFLDAKLNVKSYTERARDLIRLIESDVGRPLADLATRLLYDQLVPDCQAVLESLTPRETQVCDQGGHWHMLRILPYRTMDNVIDGVVLTLVNIDHIKKVEQAETAALVAREFFESIVRTVRQPLVVLDADLKILLGNESFHRAFRTSPAETVGTSIFESSHRQWDIPELRTLLENLLPNNNVIADFNVDHVFPEIGRRVFLVNAVRMKQSTGQPERILLAIEDITEKQP